MEMKLTSKTDRVYTIERNDDGKVVCRVDSKQLSPRRDLWNHSPNGFECGYGGSGPAQLALAILADCCGDELAVQYHQAFKWSAIATLPHEGGTLTARFVLDELEKLKAERTARDQECGE